MRVITYMKDSVAIQDYLTPSVGAYETGGGAMEDTKALANKNALAIGRLLHTLLEKKILSFKEVEFVAGEFGGEIEE